MPSASVTLNVIAANHPPVVSGVVDLGAIDEGSAGRTVTGAELLANATDPDGNPLTVTGLALTDPAAGTLTDQGGGVWQFRPEAGFSAGNGNSQQSQADVGGPSYRTMLFGLDLGF